MALPQYFIDRLNTEHYHMAVNSGSPLVNYDIPPAALPAPIYPLQSVGQVPLHTTPAVLDVNPYMGSDDIQLTQVSCVPGPVDNSLTLARPIDQSPHLDYSIDYVSSLLYIMPIYASIEVPVLSLDLPLLTHSITGDSRNINPCVASQNT